MKATLEPIEHKAYVLRLYENDDAGPRDPYIGSMSVSVDPKDNAMLLGFTSQVYGRKVRDAIGNILRENGCKSVEWERIVPGRDPKMHKVTL